MQEKGTEKSVALTATGAYLFVAGILLLIPSIQTAMTAFELGWSANCLFMTANAVGMLLLTCLSGALFHYGGVVQGRHQAGATLDALSVERTGRMAICASAVLTILYATVIMSGLVETLVGSAGLSVLIVVEELALWACNISTWVGVNQIRKSFGTTT